jgi:hypothetical protein
VDLLHLLTGATGTRAVCAGWPEKKLITIIEGAKGRAQTSQTLATAMSGVEVPSMLDSVKQSLR